MDPPLQNQLRGESDSESGEGEVEGRLRPLRCQWDVVSAVRWVSVGIMRELSFSPSCSVLLLPLLSTGLLFSWGTGVP